MKKRQLRWMRLDNAAKLYPATKRQGWNNIFRLSVTLDEEIHPPLLQAALDSVIIRFPSIAVRVRRAVFWYYLEEIPRAPVVIPDHSYPLTHMPFDDIMQCAFRVLYYKNRIAVEFFHAIADGNSGIIFLKTLAAEYLRLSQKIQIPCTQGVFDIKEPPKEEELTDDFPRYAGKISKGRKESFTYQLKGTPEESGFRNIIVAELSSDEALVLARSHGVTLTEFMVSVMISAFLDIQAERVPELLRKPVHVLVPVNLRRLFPSVTLRNFVLYVTPGVDPQLGSYELDEIIKEVHHQMSLEITAKKMASRIRSNVRLEQLKVVRILPLFIKNFGMRLVYDLTGEKTSCITMSNLGVVKVPEEMAEHVERFGFTLGVQRTSPNNCGMISYGGKLYIAMIRSIKEPILEQRFMLKLKELGLHIKLESNYCHGSDHEKEKQGS